MSVSDFRPFRWVSQSPESFGVDAGGRLRVSQLTTLADLKQTNDLQPFLFDRETIGTGDQNYSQTNGGTVMDVSSNNDAAIAQQNFWNPYFAGKAQSFIVTFANFGSQPGVIKRAGYFSTNNTTPFDSNRDGIYLESTEDGLFLCIFKDGTEVLRCGQSDWDDPWINPQDLNDDETNLNVNNFTVFAVDFLYLGGTGVRFGFFDGRNFRAVYTYNHANRNPTTFLLSPSQPVRFEIRSEGGSGSMTMICAEVASEGSIDEVGIPGGATAFDFQASTSGTIYAALGIRLKSAYKNITAIPESVKFQAENNDDFTWFLLLNPTVNGPAITWQDLDDIGDISNDVLEFAVGTGGAAGGANVVPTTGMGRRLDSGSVEGTTAFAEVVKSALRIGSTINGGLGEIWLCPRPRTAGLDVDCTLNYNLFV